MKLLAFLLAAWVPLSLAWGGTIYTPPAGGGGTTPPGPFDWADPAYESGSDQLSSIDPVMWLDASDAGFGGSTAACVRVAASRLLEVDGSTVADCSTGAAGNRVQGVLTAVTAGDFVRYFRVGFRRSVAYGTPSSALAGGAVFVDGASASSAWYGTFAYWGGADTYFYVYGFSHPVAGIGAWDDLAPTSSSDGLIYGGITTFDFALVRSGSTLYSYIAPAGGRLVLAHSWSVSTGAGKVGLRLAVTGGTSDDLSALLMAYRTSLTEVP